MIKIDNILPNELFESLEDIHLGSEYGNKSSLDDTHGHWYKDFTDGKGTPTNIVDVSKFLKGIVLDMWNHLSKQEFFQDFVPVRCYVNSMTYGTDGYIHVDSTRENETTAVIYLNKEWDPDWGGETVLFDSNGEILFSCIPKPNRAFLFDARYKHVARGLSRKCNKLRRTLVLKLRKKKSNLFEKLSEIISEEIKSIEASRALKVLEILQEQPVYVAIAGSLCRTDIEFSKIKEKLVIYDAEKIEEIVSVYRSLDVQKTFKFPILSKPIVYDKNGNSHMISEERFLQLKKIIDAIHLSNKMEINKALI